ncbi:tetratricopeptide repeat protein [Geobacter sp.]|uniref:tetratricopeptide repeat protein n=1 Tax=Geobacter sp. TaxID=46610 RepID=UPI0027B8CF53|nr:tetratricopeptide repeat protein [Geobacter sp.]
MSFWKRIFCKPSPAPTPESFGHATAATTSPPSVVSPSATAGEPIPANEFDLFISYAHQGDNASSEAVAALVTRLHAELEDDFRRRFQRDLDIFFDRENIQDFDHWQVRCHRALRSSRFFIACLSRSYLRSDACRWEWEEWCCHELERGLVGQSAASLWFVQIEELNASEDDELLRRWQGDLLQRFHIQCHEWRYDDPEAFLDESARADLTLLTEHVAQRLRLLTLDRARRGNLPWPNANFVGRKLELARLHDALLANPAVAPAGLHGIGGIGKTALALAFAYNEADAFPGGCWLLRCEGRENMLGVFCTLVHDLDLSDKLTEAEKLDDSLAVKRVFDLLRPRGPALFLLDNVDHLLLLASGRLEFLKDQPWARLLYTTRLAPADFEHAGALIRPLDLDRLPEAQAVDLIRRYQPSQSFASDDHEAAAHEIIRLLGGLTLAVETAAVYLGQSDPRIAASGYAVDLPGYVPILKEDLKRGGTDGVMSQLREVTATLRPTLKRLAPPALTVLQLAALMGPDAVALPWLRAIAEELHPELATDAPICQRAPWTQLIYTLIGMRLFSTTLEPRVVTVHRLLQQVLEIELRKDRADLQEKLTVHIRSRVATLEKTTQWHESRWELEPLEAMTDIWVEHQHPEAAQLCNAVGFFFWHGVAEWQRAEPLMRRALAIFQQSLDPDHPDFTRSLNNLAQLLKATNRPEEAEPLYRLALVISEQNLGPEHPDFARNLNNLAQLLRATNRLAEAEPLMRRALAISEQSLGPEHPDVAIRLNNLALLLQNTNRLAEAEPLIRQALTINEQCYGPEHPQVAIGLSSLAELFRDTNRLAEAEPLMRRALAIDEQCYGPEHPKVAIGLSSLAQLLQNTNRLAEAEPLMRRALAIDEESLGPDHPDIAADLNNLAALLYYTNQLTEAEPLMRRALAIDEQSYGPEHPSVAFKLNNLAQLLKATDRLAEAEPLMLRHLEIFLTFTRTTGHPHPHLQDAVNNYAGLLQQMGRSEEHILATLQQMAQEFFHATAGGQVSATNGGQCN